MHRYFIALICLAVIALVLLILLGLQTRTVVELAEQHGAGAAKVIALESAEALTDNEKEELFRAREEMKGIGAAFGAESFILRLMFFAELVVITAVFLLTVCAALAMRSNRKPAPPNFLGFVVQRGTSLTTNPCSTF